MSATICPNCRRVGCPGATCRIHTFPLPECSACAVGLECLANSFDYRKAYEALLARQPALEACARAVRASWEPRDNGGSVRYALALAAAGRALRELDKQSASLHADPADSANPDQAVGERKGAESGGGYDANGSACE